MTVKLRTISSTGPRSVVSERVELVTLHPSGGFHFASNCSVCGGGWILEGRSLGREDQPKPVNDVKQVVTCSDCGLNAVIEVRMWVITTDKRRKP